MGNVIKFPEEGRALRLGRAEAVDQPATVIILPVVRVERYAAAEDVEPEPPADNGGRRRLRRR